MNLFIVILDVLISPEHIINWFFSTIFSLNIFYTWKSNLKSFLALKPPVPRTDLAGLVSHSWDDNYCRVSLITVNSVFEGRMLGKDNSIGVTKAVVCGLPPKHNSNCHRSLWHFWDSFHLPLMLQALACLKFYNVKSSQYRLLDLNKYPITIISLLLLKNPPTQYIY